MPTVLAEEGYVLCIRGVWVGKKQRRSRRKVKVYPRRLVGGDVRDVERRVRADVGARDEVREVERAIVRNVDERLLGVAVVLPQRQGDELPGHVADGKEGGRDEWVRREDVG